MKTSDRRDVEVSLDDPDPNPSPELPPFRVVVSCFSPSATSQRKSFLPDWRRAIRAVITMSASRPSQLKVQIARGRRSALQDAFFTRPYSMRLTKLHVRCMAAHNPPDPKPTYQSCIVGASARRLSLDRISQWVVKRWRVQSGHRTSSLLIAWPLQSYCSRSAECQHKRKGFLRA